MVTSITLANFQTALGECHDAIEAENWAKARKEYAKATAQVSGLASLLEREDFKLQRASLDSLGRALDATEPAVEQRRDRGKRAVTARTGFSASDRDSTGRVCR